MKFIPSKHIVEGYGPYKDRQEVPINNKINLLFGPNNGGKSSLLKSILYAETIYNKKAQRFDPKTLNALNERINFGKIRDLINIKHEEGVFRFGQEGRFELNLKNLNPEFKNHLGINDERSEYLVKGTIQWCIGLGEVYDSDVSLKDFRMDISEIKIYPYEHYDSEDIFSYIDAKPENDPVECRLNNQTSTCILEENEQHKKLVFSEFDYNFLLLFSLITGQNEGVHKFGEKKFKKFIKNFKRYILESDQYLRVRDDFTLEQYHLDQYQSLQEDSFHSLIFNLKNPELSLDLDILQIFDAIDYSPLTNYIHPLRSIPENLIMDDEVESMYSALFEQNTATKMIEGEPTGFPGLTNANVVPIDEVEVLNRVLNDIDIDYRFKIDKLTSDLSPELTRKSLVLQNIHTGRISSIGKLGTGLSQLLPIIIKLFQTSNNEYSDFIKFVTVVEQPELHLHPGIQAKFGPLCSKYTKMNKQGSVYFETHSEHIIKSIQLEVAKYYASGGKEGLSKDDISILYVSSSDGESNIREIKLDETGSFTEPWPDDFFDLSADLSLARLRESVKNKN